MPLSETVEQARSQGKVVCQARGAVCQRDAARQRAVAGLSRSAASGWARARPQSDYEVDHSPAGGTPA
jgi:hypothetical protein